MKSAPHLFNEDARLAALAEYDLENQNVPIDLDELVQLTARLFNVPIVLVSIVERDRQSFKASVGVDVCETGRDVSFCAHAIALKRQDILIVPDATLDPRFATNPLVTGELGIRFYAGVPLRSPDGFAIGTLCIIDRLPRQGLSESERDDLKSLAALVTDKLEMRRLAVASAAGQSRFENIAQTSPDGILCTDDQGTIKFWNESAHKIFGYSADQALGQNVDLVIPKRHIPEHMDAQSWFAEQAPRLVGKTIELDALRQDGQETPIELSLSTWREDEQRSNFGAIFRDIRERRANAERLFNLAHLDSLTGLPNRSVLLSRLADCTKAGRKAALIMIDLDGFKDVNDTLGHNAGDMVLRQVAGRLLESVRSTDSVARLGGDEFAILLPDVTDRERLADQAERVVLAVASPFPIDGQIVHVSASLGIALYPSDAEHGEELLSAADLAMYQAKAEGRDCWRFFASNLRDSAVARRAFEGEIRRGIEQGEFELFYQPQIRLDDEAIIGVEALLRWRHPTEGILAPGRFLSAIESSVLAAEMGRWVIDTACRDAVALREHIPDLIMGINLFGAQFRTGRLAEDVTAALNHWQLTPDAIELEITENIILRHDDQMLRPLRELHALGVGIAFDDFGTGFGSLSLLKRYPLTRIKIDKSFVDGICHAAADAAIVKSVIHLAGSLDLDVIAEGVETTDQRDCLKAGGCPVVQGYLYSKPRALPDLLDLLTLSERGEAASSFVKHCAYKTDAMPL